MARGLNRAPSELGTELPGTVAEAGGEIGDTSGSVPETVCGQTARSSRYGRSIKGGTVLFGPI